MTWIRQIVSGGQTGADRAALDIALELGLNHGGWIPKSFAAEDGALDRTRYPRLRETSTEEPNERTALNVRDSDGTLILSHGPLHGGSWLTLVQAEAQGKPCLHVDLDKVPLADAVQLVQQWLASSRVAVLNVAGPRQSEDPGIYAATSQLLKCLVLAPGGTDCGDGDAAAGRSP